MPVIVFLLCLLSQSAPDADRETAQTRDHDALRQMYREDADKYRFQLAKAGQPPLELEPRPVLRWFNDGDWSGDVFVWTTEKRPAVIGCILSGPAKNDQRLVFHEFHLLSDKALAPTEMQTGRRWEPISGLPVLAIPEGPAPAKSAPVRLTQMRELSRRFTAHMQAEGVWELRALPQPLYRYGSDRGDLIDGALFTYVWSKGTDPEVILLLECRRTETGPAWYYAPVRFSNRPVWLKYNEKEVWRVENHREPDGKVSDLNYTTAYARTTPRPVSANGANAVSPKKSK